MPLKLNFIYLKFFFKSSFFFLTIYQISLKKLQKLKKKAFFKSQNTILGFLNFRNFEKAFKGAPK